MGAGASVPYKTIDEAIAAGERQEEINAYLTQTSNKIDGLWLPDPPEFLPVFFCWGASVFCVKNVNLLTDFDRARSEGSIMGLDVIDDTSWSFAPYPHVAAGRISLHHYHLEVRQDNNAYRLYRCKDPRRVTLALAALARCHLLGAMSAVLGDEATPPRPLFRPVGSPANHNMLVPQLCEAVESDDADEILTLLRLGANVHGRTKSGWSILQLASFGSKRQTIRLLLTHCGLSINHRDSVCRGSTVLHILAMVGLRDRMPMLIELGADVNIQCNLGFTPLHYAVMPIDNFCEPEHKRKHEDAKTEAVNFLLRHGANRGIRSAKGMTPALMTLALKEPDRSPRRALLMHGCWTWGIFRTLLNTRALRDAVTNLVPLNTATGQPQDLLMTDARTGRRFPAATNRLQLHTMLGENPKRRPDREKFLFQKLFVPLLQASMEEAFSVASKKLLEYVFFVLVTAQGQEGVHEAERKLVRMMRSGPHEALARLLLTTHTHLGKLVQRRTRPPTRKKRRRKKRRPVSYASHIPRWLVCGDPVRAYHELRRVGRCADVRGFAALLTEYRVLTDGSDELWEDIFTLLNSVQRTWCRVIWSGGADVGHGVPWTSKGKGRGGDDRKAAMQMHNFFGFFPGLKKFIGGIIVQYVNWYSLCTHR